MLHLNIVWGSIIYVCLMLFSFGAYYILTRLNTGINASGSTQILSYGSCFACGVFLSACFLGLSPHMHKHEDDIRKFTNNSTWELSGFENFVLKSDFVILVGFSLILFLGQLGTICDKDVKGTHCEHSTVAPHENAMSSSNIKCRDVFTRLGDKQPLVSAHFDSDDSDQDVIEFRHPLNMPVSASELPILYSSKVSLSFSQECVRLVALLASLSSHSVFEGIALGLQNDIDEFYKLIVAIMMHETLCAVAFGMSLAKHNASIGLSLYFTTFFSTAIPMGILISSFLIDSIDSCNALWSRFILEGLAIGAFIYVACVEMISDEFHRKVSGSVVQRFFKFLIFCSGISCYCLLSSAICHHC